MALTAPVQIETPSAHDAAPAQTPTIENPALFCWTETAVAQLRHLWATGRSAAQIAREIGGLSRAAVIGKARRLRLDSRRPVPPREPGSISAVPLCAPPVSEISRAEKARRQRERALARLNGDARPRHRKTVPPETPPLASRPCSLLELSRDTCRWPIGHPDAEGFHFCGGTPDAGHPYCAHHRRIAHWRPDPFEPAAPS